MELGPEGAGPSTMASQLETALERVRQDACYATSDSGAVSDLDSSCSACEGPGEGPGEGRSPPLQLWPTAVEGSEWCCDGEGVKEECVRGGQLATSAAAKEERVPSDGLPPTTPVSHDNTTTTSPLRQKDFKKPIASDVPGILSKPEAGDPLSCGGRQEAAPDGGLPEGVHTAPQLQGESTAYQPQRSGGVEGGGVEGGRLLVEAGGQRATAPCSCHAHPGRARRNRSTGHSRWNKTMDRSVRSGPCKGDDYFRGMSMKGGGRKTVAGKASCTPVWDTGTCVGGATCLGGATCSTTASTQQHLDIAQFLWKGGYNDCFHDAKRNDCTHKFVTTSVCTCALQDGCKLRKTSRSSTKPQWILVYNSSKC